MAVDYEACDAQEAAAKDFDYNGNPMQPDSTFVIAEEKRLAEQERQEIQNRLSKGQSNPNLVISQDYGEGFSFVALFVSLIFSKSNHTDFRTLTDVVAPIYRVPKCNECPNRGVERFRFDNRSKRPSTTQTNSLPGLLSGSVRIVRLKLRKQQSASKVCLESRHPEFVEFTGPRG
jgi:hypothetical protein